MGTSDEIPFAQCSAHKLGCLGCPVRRTEFLPSGLEEFHLVMSCLADSFRREKSRWNSNTVSLSLSP